MSRLDAVLKIGEAVATCFSAASAHRSRHDLLAEISTLQASLAEERRRSQELSSTLAHERASQLQERGDFERRLRELEERLPRRTQRKS